MFSPDIFQPNRIQVIDEETIIGYIEETNGYFIAHHSNGKQQPHNCLKAAQEWFYKPQDNNQLALL